jgi:hypothetical protein
LNPEQTGWSRSCCQLHQSPIANHRPVVLPICHHECQLMEFGPTLLTQRRMPISRATMGNRTPFSRLRGECITIYALVAGECRRSSVIPRRGGLHESRARCSRCQTLRGTHEAVMGNRTPTSSIPRKRAAVSTMTAMAGAPFQKRPPLNLLAGVHRKPLPRGSMTSLPTVNLLAPLSGPLGTTLPSGLVALGGLCRVHRRSAGQRGVSVPQAVSVHVNFTPSRGLATYLG